MKIHVLAGDALAESFKQTNIDGEIIICRECLVEGDLEGAGLEEFWQTRAAFISNSYGESKEKYIQNTAAEFEKLRSLATSGAEINLWFEYELFCQVNLWFCLYLLRESNGRIFRVAPVVRQSEDVWKGFGGLETADLKECYSERAEFTESDILLGKDLWKAYQNADHQTLEKLSGSKSACFPFLDEVCRAEIEKSARPKLLLREILASGANDFGEIFREFSNRAGVYGFGDAQVQRILREI